MVVIKFAGFTGEQPRIIPRLLPDSGAQSAVDVRLDDGGLTPMRRSKRTAKLASSGQKTIFRHGSAWLSWPGIVHAVPGPVATDRLYFTGDGAPKMRVGENTYPLGVPHPTGALTATLAGTGAGDVQTRTYVYTWVTEYGEESEPSPPAASVDWKPGNTVTLSGFAAPPAGRGIIKQRIYRTQTGRAAGTYLYFIAERNATAANFNDAIPVDAFNEPLRTADWNAPPDNLQGLITVANGIMAAFVGKDLYFCEPFHPHAWPEKYILTMDYEIVALAATQTSIMVVTKGTPYIVAGAHPDSMQQVKLEANLPCINARGCIDLGFAFCYPSKEGLVAIRADGSVGLVSGALFNTEEWQRLSPQTMVAGQMSGRYVAFYDTIDDDDFRRAGALFIDVGQQPFLIRSSAIASATFYDVEKSELHYLATGSTDIVQLDPLDAPRANMYWKSKPFVLGAPDTFGAILIDTDVRLSGNEEAEAQAELDAAIAENEARIANGTHKGPINASVLNDVPLAGHELVPLPTFEPSLVIGVYADGKRVASISATGRPVRLPAGFLARTWEIDVSGTIKVAQVAIGRTVEELRGVV
ncbi:hypothetical protein SAMN05216456_1323 [Devosia crocina]|uniref:Uncharacterized protein n=1 Tax=Devosia crocina TaxID=429728 RepID=A0A1I7N9S1_9HYPH|nr:hypothetical protein [Devosia crocina]SFV31381.1 hypothetical protein SAMN05216456_1323 [Devosia crocina]